MEVELNLHMKLPEGTTVHDFEAWLAYNLGDLPFISPSPIQNHELCDMEVISHNFQTSSNH